MSTRIEKQGNWMFWLRWVLASIVGAYLGGAAGALATLIAARIVGGGAEDRVPTEILLGTGLGIAQWLVLRRRVPGAGWWMWASIAGAAAFSVLSRPLMLAFYSITDSVLRIRALVDALALGAFLGFAQWLVLRHRVSRSGWWVIASVGGYGIATLSAGKGVSSLGEVFAFLVVPPAITGLALARLLRHPPAETPDPTHKVPGMADLRLGSTVVRLHVKG